MIEKWKNKLENEVERKRSKSREGSIDGESSHQDNVKISVSSRGVLSKSIESSKKTR